MPASPFHTVPHTDFQSTPSEGLSPLMDSRQLCVVMCVHMCVTGPRAHTCAHVYRGPHAHMCAYTCTEVRGPTHAVPVPVRVAGVAQAMGVGGKCPVGLKRAGKGVPLPKASVQLLGRGEGQNLGRGACRVQPPSTWGLGHQGGAESGIGGAHTPPGSRCGCDTCQDPGQTWEEQAGHVTRVTPACFCCYQR